jgi:membrane protein
LGEIQDSYFCGTAQNVDMAQMWTLGGLPVRELLRRTWAETWEDAVYGQAGRMAFYHFLAIFPCLLIFLAFAAHLSSVGTGMTQTANGIVQEVLPNAAAGLIQQMVMELKGQTPTGFELLLTLAGALWAAMNGTWALVFGLNIAYEVDENRGWWRLGVTILGLTTALAFAGALALAILYFATTVFHASSSIALRALEWVAILALLMFSFALIFRFAPNLDDAKWKWSTPGSACALLIWVGATIGLRIYFTHITNYERSYGHLNTVVMVLLWLYFTNAAIMIGGEMNSEIEKASGEGQRQNRNSRHGAAFLRANQQ